MAYGINKLHKYAGPNNWLLVDKSGNFQEIRESIFDALFEQYSCGFACKLDILRGRAGLHVYFNDLSNEDSWPIGASRLNETGWQTRVISNLPEECNLSSAAKAELIDRIDWYEGVTFFFL